MKQRHSSIIGFALLVLMAVYIQASIAEGDITQMKEEHSDVLEYYAQPGIMTDPKEHGELLDTLPTEISELCAVVQGLMIHTYWAKRYGIDLPEERKKEVNIRSAAYMIDRIQELSDLPLIEKRPLEKRIAGTCRDFSTLLCAMLRHKGIPARARCGFGRYFTPDSYEDHWI